MENDTAMSRQDDAAGTAGWPTVSAHEIAVADFEYDLAYMGVYVRLKIRNGSPYLVREAELRIDGVGQTAPGVVTSRDVRVGPLFPGEHVPAEVGIGDRAGISGLHFEGVAAHAVRLTPPSEMVPASRYPGLVAEIVSVREDDEAADFRELEDDGLTPSSTAPGVIICVRVRNDGASVVERARLRLLYFDDAGDAPGRQEGAPREPDTEWIFDMPRVDWNPYRWPAAPGATYQLADPLPPGGTNEFAIYHYSGGPHGWARRLDATSIEVLELRLRTA